MHERPDLGRRAGIAGLATARAQGSLGITADVVERRPDQPGPRFGLNPPGNAIRALHRLGVAQAVIDAGVSVVRRELATEAGAEGLVSGSAPEASCRS